MRPEIPGGVGIRSDMILVTRIDKLGIFEDTSLTMTLISYCSGRYGA
jgi:hypothetical protein